MQNIIDQEFYSTVLVPLLVAQRLYQGDQSFRKNKGYESVNMCFERVLLSNGLQKDCVHLLKLFLEQMFQQENQTNSEIWYKANDFTKDLIAEISVNQEKLLNSISHEKNIWQTYRGDLSTLIRSLHVLFNHELPVGVELSTYPYRYISYCIGLQKHLKKNNQHLHNRFFEQKLRSSTFRKKGQKLIFQFCRNRLVLSACRAAVKVYRILLQEADDYLRSRSKETTEKPFYRVVTGYLHAGTGQKPEVQDMQKLMLHSSRPKESSGSPLADRPTLLHSNPMHGRTLIYHENSSSLGAHTVVGNPNDESKVIVLTRGQVVASYRIIALLGQGSMGSVYQARHSFEEWAEVQGGDVAIKIMHHHLLRGIDKTFRKMFVREALIGKTIRHPHLVSVHEVLATDSHLGLVMDLVPGKRLLNWLTETSCTLQDIVVLLKKIARGIDFLHENKIVHRDIKPTNIMIKPDGNPVILDLGVAAVGTDASRNGTPIYMPPEDFPDEQVLGLTDRYAYAVLTYLMLSGGKLPWSNVRPGENVMKREEEFVSMTHWKPNISNDVDSIIQAVLFPTMERRFSNCLGFIQAIDRELNV